MVRTPPEPAYETSHLIEQCIHLRAQIDLIHRLQFDGHLVVDADALVASLFARLQQLLKQAQPYRALPTGRRQPTAALVGALEIDCENANDERSAVQRGAVRTQG